MSTKPARDAALAESKATTEQWSVKWRPQSLGTYLAKPETKTLIKSILSDDTIPHTIAIFGPSGCGKTTLARIIAYGINRIPYGSANMDITEHNLSDERGIDSVRALIRGANYHPQHRARVRIMDEVHALTSQATSALLKPIEEPVAGQMWILCTDQPAKLPATILNRCLTIQLSKPEVKDVVPLLRWIAGKEGLDVGAAADTLFNQIANNAQAVPRAAVQLLESFARVWRQQQRDGGKLTPEELNRLMITAIQQSPEVAANKVAVTALIGLYTGNIAQVVKVCNDVQQRESLSQLIYKLLDFNLWLMRQNSGVSQWANVDTNALNSFLKKNGSPPGLKQIAYVHKALVDMKAQQATYAVDESHLITATLANLAGQFARKEAA